MTCGIQGPDSNSTDQLVPKQKWKVRLVPLDKWRNGLSAFGKVALMNGEVQQNVLSNGSPMAMAGGLRGSSVLMLLPLKRLLSMFYKNGSNPEGSITTPVFSEKKRMRDT
jgi:hypothetical protein